MNIVFEAIAEDRPGPKWRTIYDRHWHAYSRWFMRDGLKARPTYLASLRAIRQHMPELLPSYEAVAEAAGGGDLEARFLSMWCPPMYVGGCSQAITLGGEPALIRNYDYSPKLLEGTWFASRLNGKHVIAMVDCLWGVLDGINEDGLAVSLAFGGRTAVAEGFGIPIVMRYVLEFASSVAEAVKLLDRVPVHMSYTVSLLDRSGRHATVFLAPDRPTEILDQRTATNHQREVEWPRHATATRSVERAESLEQAMVDAPETEALLKAFLRPPVFQTAYGRGYGTLYTAVYRPEDASAELVWPVGRWRQSSALFAEGSRTIRFAEGNAPARLRPAKGMSIRGGIL
jgi:predicted choloylglycine hydrolase